MKINDYKFNWTVLKEAKQLWNCKTNVKRNVS